MNIRRHQLVIDMINLAMCFIPTYLTIAILLYYFDPQSPVHTLLLLPVPVLSYLIRKYTHYIWSFLLLHGILLLGLLLLLTNIYIATAAGIYVVILTSVAYYRRNKGTELENTSSLLWIPILLLYLICVFTGMEELQQLCFILSIVFAILYVVNEYLLNLERFVFNHEGMVNLPFHQIKNSNTVMVAFLCGLILGAMLLFSRIPLGRLLSRLGQQIIRFLRYLISLIQFEEPEVSSIPEEEDMIIEDYPISEPSPLMELIAQVLQWVVIILVTVFAVAAILYALYQIYQYFYLKSEEALKDQIEFLSPFVQGERSKRAPRNKLRTLFDRSNNAQIRKYYTQAVAASLTPGISLDKSLTPSQLSEIILPSQSSDSKTDIGYIIAEHESSTVDALGNPPIHHKRIQITNYYEKARYSNEDCTKEEVQLLRKLLKSKL